MDPLTIILAASTGLATVTAIRTRSKWRTRAMEAGDLWNAAERDCNRKQAAIDDLERMAEIRNDQLVIAQATLTKHEARRIADNAARKVRRQRAKGVV